MKRLLTMMVYLLLALAACNVLAQDEEPCQDHPMFSRMNNMHLYECQQRFDAVEFEVSDEETQTLEGQKTFLRYELQEGANPPSPLQIIRNYENAVKSIGGQVVYNSQLTGEGLAIFKIVKAGQEVWLRVQTFNEGWEYDLIVLEKGEMVQEVTASDLLAALNKDGRVALYIHFDTGQAEIKPASQPTIDQVAQLLESNPQLKLSVEGHTDNIGDPAMNKTLSEQRAASVVAALVEAGVDQGRLEAVGHGQDKPIADNSTEEGRAKNRRVELVKK